MPMPAVACLPSHDPARGRSGSTWAERRCWSASLDAGTEVALGEPRGLDRARPRSSWSTCWSARSRRRARRGPAPSRSASGSRRRSTTSAGSRSPPSTCRSTTCRSASSSASEPGCRSSSTTTPTSPPSPSTSTAPGGAPTTSVLLTIGTGIGGGLILGGEIYRGATGAGAELGHMVIDDGRPAAARATARAAAASRPMPPERRSAARAARRRESEPESALGRDAAEGQEIDGRAVTEAALAGDEAANRRLRLDRHGGSAWR